MDPVFRGLVIAAAVALIVYVIVLVVRSFFEWMDR